MSVRSSTRHPYLKSPYRRGDRWTFRGRARLFDDHIAFSEWTLRGLRRYALPLDDIARVVWWSGVAVGRTNLCLHLHDGRDIALAIDGAGLWKAQIESLSGRRIGDRGTLPGQRVKPAAAA